MTCLRTILTRAPVIPVLRIERLDQAQALAQALVDGGLDVLEITLRTPVALEAITLISQSVPDAIVGAGTIISPRQLDQAQAAGASFAVSPGLSSELAVAAREGTLPLLPGVMTPGEAMQAQALGFTCLKLFPASIAGGCGWLRAIHGPLPELAFCPTGGIGEDQVADYLALPNVLCVGGSWLAPPALVQAGDWAAISRLAARVTAQGKGHTPTAPARHESKPLMTGEEDPEAGLAS